MCITSYKRLNIVLITIILVIFTFNGINLAYESFQKIDYEESKVEEIEQIIYEEKSQEETEENIEKTLENTINLNEQIWQVEIPSIGLVAPISQGTTQEVMYEYVGHFENTKFWKGNIGLAAHNRGYPINYFENVKDLKQGDEIIYKTPYGEKVYEVVMYEVIEQTNWSYLQETQDNRITLITCVRNKPTKRLCVQAIEKV